MFYAEGQAPFFIVFRPEDAAGSAEVTLLLFFAMLEQDSASPGASPSPQPCRAPAQPRSMARADFTAPSPWVALPPLCVRPPRRCLAIDAAPAVSGSSAMQRPAHMPSEASSSAILAATRVRSGRNAEGAGPLFRTRAGVLPPETRLALRRRQKRPRAHAGRHARHRRIPAVLASSHGQRPCWKQAGEVTWKAHGRSIG